MDLLLQCQVQRQRDAAVSDSKAPNRAEHLRVVELVGDFSEKAAAGAVASSQDPIRGFFDRLFDGSCFGCVVLIAKKGLFGRKDQIAWPQVIASVDDAKSVRDELEKLARSGFQVVVGTNSSLRDLETLFESMGYRAAGTGLFAGGGEHDPAQAAWDKEGFLRAVNVATKLCDQGLCVFAHDGDPVYLLAQ
jgi:hypothetical protein